MDEIKIEDIIRENDLLEKENEKLSRDIKIIKWLYFVIALILFVGGMALQKSKDFNTSLDILVESQCPQGYNIKCVNLNIIDTSNKQSYLDLGTLNNSIQTNIG